MNIKKIVKPYAENRKVCWLITVLDGGPRVSNKENCFECQWFKLNQNQNRIKLTVESRSFGGNTNRMLGF